MEATSLASCPKVFQVARLKTCRYRGNSDLPRFAYPGAGAETLPQILRRPGQSEWLRVSSGHNPRTTSGGRDERAVTCDPGRWRGS